MKALVGTFNEEKALVGTFSGIVRERFGNTGVCGWSLVPVSLVSAPPPQSMTRRRPLHTRRYTLLALTRHRDELLHVQRQAGAQGGGQVQERGKVTEL